MEKYIGSHIYITHRSWIFKLILIFIVCVISASLTGCRSSVGELAPIFDPGERESTINDIFAMINDIRTDNGLNKLIWDEDLAQKAQVESQRIADSAIAIYYEGPRWPGRREIQYGGHFCLNEEVAGKVFSVYLRNPTYKAGILDAEMSICGIGVAEGEKCIGVALIATK